MAYWTPEQLKLLQPTEGRFDQIHYPSGYTKGGVKSSASGGYGFLDSTWAQFAGPEIAAKYPRAYMAPEALQTEVALRTPTSHWTGTDAQGRPFNAAAQGIAGGIGKSAFPGGEGYNPETGSTQLTVSPQLEPPPAFLDRLLGGQGQTEAPGEGQGGDDFLDKLLQPQQATPEVPKPQDGLQALGDVAELQDATGARVPPVNMFGSPSDAPPPLASVNQGAPPPLVEAQGGGFLDTLLTHLNPIGSAQAAAIEPPARGAAMPPPAVPGAAMAAQGGQAAASAIQGPQVLDRLLTQAGVVPGRETDVQQFQQQEAQAQQPRQPLIGTSGAELTGRIPQMAEAITPYIAGAAPGGSLSAGMRLPGRGQAAGIPISSRNVPGELPIVRFRKDAAAIEASLPPAAEGTTRVWRGNRPGEIGTGRQFTSDLPGIALPFREPYGGNVSYIDVPTADLGKFENKMGAGGVEFYLPADMAAKAREVVVSPTAAAGGRGGGRPPPETPKEADGPGPILDPPTVGESLGVTTTRIDDALYRISKNNTADKIEARQFVEKLKADKPEWVNPEFQERVYAEREQRLVDPKAPYSPEVEAYFRAVEPLVSEERRLWQEASRKLGADAGELPATAEGYVHRKIVGREPFGEKLDPDSLRSQDPIMGTRSLSRKAGSLEQREFFVLEDDAGRRVLNTRRLSDTDWKMGEEVDSGGRKWTVKPATTAEIERTTAERGQPVTYHKNHLANTLDNVLRLRRVNRNIDLLDGVRPELQEKGLFVGRAEKNIPEGFQRVELPQLDGWAPPKIANTLNDFYNKADPGSLVDFLERANRFMIGSLFITPIPHAGNVGAHWIVGRGWDWMKPSQYRELQKTGTRAVQAIWNQNQDYTRMLREGSGLLYGDVANQNFYKVMMEKLFNEQMADPHAWAPLANRLGFTGTGATAVDKSLDAVRRMVAAEYRWSSKMLWAANDVFMLQRQWELERKGIPTREAIRQAERDIPNYRIPSEVMNMRPLAQFLKSPIAMNFGRYKYGQLRAYGAILNDLLGNQLTARKIGGHVPTGEERLEAAGKALVLVLTATALYPMADYALRKALGTSGKDQPFVQRFGPFSILDSAYDFSQGQKEWGSALSSVITPAPMVEHGMEWARNRDFFGRPVIDAGTPLGKGVQAGEAAARLTYPGQLLTDMAGREGGVARALGGLVGVRVPPKDATAKRQKAQKFNTKRALKREARDPIQQFIERQIRPGVP